MIFCLAWYCGDGRGLERSGMLILMLLREWAAVGAARATALFDLELKDSILAVKWG